MIQRVSRMPHLVFKADCHSPDLLRGARRLVTVVLVVGMAMVLAVAADMRLRAPYRNQAARAWMQALALSAPALWPAGSGRRHPEMTHPGVDLRFAPGLAAEP